MGKHHSGVITNSHRVREKHHAKGRMSERFNIDISNAEYRKLCDAIKKQKAEFIDRQSLSKTRWLVEHNGKKIVAVYHNHHIITFLYPEWLNLER